MEQPTLLIVDDEDFFRQLFHDLLAEDGYLIETCGTGAEALQRLQRGGIDLLLTDMVMPGTSGLDLLQASRALANPPEVILVTGHASLESAIQALKNGARDYLVKPFDHQELRHVVRNCLEQRRLLEENQLLKKNIRLFQAGQSLASLMAVEPLLRQALSVILREEGGGWGLGFLLDPEDRIHCPAVQGLTSPQASRLAQQLKPLLPACQTETCRPLTLPAAIWEELQLTAPPQFQLVPLRSQGELKGALALAGTSGVSNLSSQDLLYLAEEAALGFDNAFRYEHARDLMYTDDLTGLYNHRYLHLALEKELSRAKRYGLKFSLVFIDLDRFKLVNDRHGHLVGSAVLAEVGQLLRASARDADILCRFGGDEFAVLLLETDAAGAQVVAERIRSSIEEHHFLQQRGPLLRITATVGYSTFPIDAVDQQGLLDLADQAMYVGKRERNVSRSACDIERLRLRQV